MAASLSPSEMLSVGWAGTVRAWQAQLGVGPGEAVRALCATTVTVDRGGALVQLTPPALFALESADQATQTKPWVFSEVFYSMARAWNGNHTPWHPDEGVSVDVSTLGALWLAGHIHYAAETFKSTRKIYRQSTSWVDRLLGEMLAPLGLMDQETHCRLLESTGPLMTTWKPGASAWLNTSVWGTAIFEGYRRHCKTSNGWPARRRQAWTESFLSVIRAGVVHAPSGGTFHQQQTRAANVEDLWSPLEPPLALDVQLDRMLDVMVGLRGSPVRWNHPTVRRLLDKCWAAQVAVPAPPHHAERMAHIAQQDPAIHAELRAHAAHAPLTSSPARPRVRA